MKHHTLKMFRRLSVFLFLLVSSSFAATTLYVGSCHKPSYTTISAAVAAAAPGSTVDVCPGTYPEQVFITQSLTLQGHKSGNKDRATITVPIGVTGLLKWQYVADPDGGAAMIAPQIYVNSPAGAVTIKNLTIDASGETGSPACLAAGYWHTIAIFVQDSSSVISGVNTLGQGKNSGCGDGIRDFGGGVVSLALNDSELEDAHESGLILEGTGLTVNVRKNVLDLTNTNFGISSSDVAGTISENFLNGSGDLVGDFGNAGSVTFSDNVLRGESGCSAAMLLEGAAQVTGNKIEGCQEGIYLESGGTNAVSIENNLIFNTILGMSLGCDSNVTLSGNTVNNSLEGVDFPASSVSGSEIAFYNVDMVNNNTCP